VNLIRTLPALPYSLRQPEDLDTSAEDHAADCLRYGLLSIGTGPVWHFPTAVSVAGGVGIDGETRVVEDLGMGGWLPEDLVPPWSPREEGPSGDRRDAWSEHCL
jgi:hypothetical protein